MIPYRALPIYRLRRPTAPKLRSVIVLLLLKAGVTES